MSTEPVKHGCTGKRHFAQFCQAAKVAKRRNRGDGGAHVEAYHCRHCHGFHIGERRDYGHRKREEEPAT